jgi:hypothetical protein
MTLANHPLFAIAATRTFSAPVEVTTPNDAGGFDKTKFVAKFAYKTRDQLAAMAKQTVPEQMMDVLLGWDLTDANNAGVPFDAAHKEALMQHTAAWRALSEAFYSHLGGAAAKN